MNVRRVGHKGADLIAPGNTYASFDAALQAGVDMIEFDVLQERGSDRLLLAHDYEDAARHSPVSFEEALAYLIDKRFDGIDDGKRLGISDSRYRPPRVDRRLPASLGLPDVADACDRGLVKERIADRPSRIVCAQPPEESIAVELVGQHIGPERR